MTKPANSPIILGEAPKTLKEFAAFGANEFAYVRSLSASDVRELFPQVPPLPPGLFAFALFAADGTPVSLAESHAAALASASHNQLATLSVH